MQGNDAVEVGNVRGEETDAFLRVMCDAYGMDFEAAHPIFYADPYFDLQNKYVLRVHGEIVSCLTIVERQCRVGKSVVRLAGIAGVATRPRCQRNGFAGRLLTEVVYLLLLRRFPMAALFPVSRAYYRRFGWETGGEAHTVRVPLSSLNACNACGGVRRAVAEDITTITGIYDRAASERSFYTLRDMQWWQYLLTYVRNPYVYVSERGVVEGYILYDFQPEGNAVDPALPGEPQLQFMRLLEMHSETPEALAALRSHLASNSQATAMEYTAPVDFIAGKGFEAAPVTNPSFMVRIVDWQQMLHALIPNWDGFEGRCGLVLNDPLLSTTPRAALVMGSGGQAKMESLDASRVVVECSDFVVGDIHAWSSVADGYRSGAAACTQGVLQPSTSAAAKLVTSLFPSRDPFLPAADHF